VRDRERDDIRADKDVDAVVVAPDTPDLDAVSFRLSPALCGGLPPPPRLGLLQGHDHRSAGLAVALAWPSAPCQKPFKPLPHATSPSGLVRGFQEPLADGAQLAQLGAPPRLTGLLVVFPLAQLLGQAAPLEQLLEAAQGRADRLTVVDAHPQRHGYSFTGFSSDGTARALQGGRTLNLSFPGFPSRGLAQTAAGAPGAVRKQAKTKWAHLRVSPISAAGPRPHRHRSHHGPRRRVLHAAWPR